MLVRFFFASRSTVPDLSALIQGNTSKRFQLSWRYVVPHRWRGWRLFSAAHPTVLDDISSSWSSSGCLRGNALQSSGYVTAELGQRSRGNIQTLGGLTDSYVQVFTFVKRLQEYVQVRSSSL